MRSEKRIDTRDVFEMVATTSAQQRKSKARSPQSKFSATPLSARAVSYHSSRLLRGEPMKPAKSFALLLLTLFLSLTQACGDDDDNDTSGKGGKGGGTGGKSGSISQTEKSSNIDFSQDCTGNPPYKDQSCVNINCPDVNANPSIDEAGDCCKRMDLIESNKNKASDEKVYEYRLMMSKVITISTTVGATAIQNSTAGQQDRRQIVSLFRLTGDLTKEGEISFEQGPGVFNCDDGTYSFYSDTAAKAEGATWSAEPDRYASRTVKGKWYPEDGRIDIALADLRKGITGQPNYDSSKADYPIGSEILSQGYYPLKFPIGVDNTDCIGSRDDTGWDLSGITETFYSMKALEKITNIPNLGNPAETSCQFTAFYILSEGKEKTIKCDMERCDKSVDATCPWMELPDSLCPDDSDQEKIFPCHLGDKKKAGELKKLCDQKDFSNDLAPKQWCENLNKWPEPPCSMTAPTKITETPQCCDPLGKDSSIPACNAWRNVSKIAVASVQITDQPTDKLATLCQE
jgi:hypothetical protein